MKTLLFLFSFFLTHLFFSQGNLQFNQVYNYSGTLSNAYPSNGTNNVGYTHGIAPITVPPSKVWRIERIWISGFNNQSVFVNNLVIKSALNNVELEITTPIWLKSGDVLRLAGSLNTQWYSINIVEFNVIP